MVNRRFEAKILKLKEIYQGEIKEFSEKKYFYINDEDIPKVRVFGVVLDKYESRGEEHSYFSILLDDGSGTINIKHWVRQENDFNPQLSNIVQSIEIGNIVDLVGKVRDYNNELYLVPESINPGFGISGEINRRSKILQMQIETHGIGSEVKKPLIGDELSEDMEDLSKSILNIMSSNISENTIENLAKLLSTSDKKIKQEIRNLQIDGAIYNPRPGLYQKTEGD